MGQGEEKASWKRRTAGLVFIALALATFEVCLAVTNLAGPVWAFRLVTASLAIAYGAWIGGGGVIPGGVILAGINHSVRQPSVRAALARIDWEAAARFGDTLLRSLYLLIFAGLTYYGYRQWLRNRHWAGIWLTLGFMALTLVAVGGLIIQAPFPEPTWLLRLIIISLGIFPLTLFQFTRSFKKSAAWPAILVAGLTAALSAYVLWLPHIPNRSENPGQGFAAFLMLFMLYWVAVAGASAIDLWRAGSRQRGSAKIRMRLLGAAAATSSFAIILSFSFQRTPYLLLLVQALALIGALGFYFGYSTPGWMRRMLRRDASVYADASEGFIRATTRGEIYERFINLAAEVVSANRAVLAGHSGEELASCGTGDERNRTVVLEYGFGRLSLETTPYAPFFSESDFSRIHSLAALANVALTRVETEKKYRNIFDYSPIGIFQTSLDGRLMVANPTLARICGYSSPEEMLEELSSDIDRKIYVKPNRREEFIRLMRERGRIAGFVSEIYRKDGSTMWISENAHAVKDDNGNILFYEGTVEDITERKVAENRLKREIEFSESLINSSLNGVLAFDTDMRYTIWNPAMERLTGKKAGEVLGRLSYEVFPFLEEQGVIDNYRKVLEGKIPPVAIVRFDIPETGKKGITQAFYMPIRDIDGNVSGGIGLVMDITEPQEARERLERSQAQLEEAQSLAHLGSWVWDMAENKIEWSDELYRIYGVDIGTPLSFETYIERVHPEDREYLQETINVALDTGQEFIVEHRAVRPSGEVRWIQGRGRAVYGDGGPIRLFGTAQDITKQKFYEERLTRQNTSLAALHEVTMELMGPLETDALIALVVEKAGELLDAPNAYVYMVDRDGENMSVRVGLGVFKDYIGFSLGRGEGMAGKVWESGQVMIINDYDSWPERAEVFPRGVFHAVAGAPLKSGGQVVGVIGLAHLDADKSFSREQTDLLAQFAELASIRLDRVRLHEAASEELNRRRKIEEAVRESEEKFRTVTATASDAIITTTSEGQIIYFNPAAERLFGYTQDQAMGRGLQMLFPSEYYDPEQYGISKYIPSDEAKLMGGTIQMKGCNKGKESFPIEVSLSRWESGESSFFTLIIRDVTERRRIEQAKSDFVSLVSHQLKTPVALVRGYTDNLLSGVLGELTDRQKQYIKDIQDISARNYRLITDLLNLSRLERGVISFNPKPVSLKDIVDQAVKPYQARIADKGLNLILEGDDVMVRADIFKSAEAIGNVVDNAMKFTSEGSVAVRWYEKDGHGVVEVADQGPGMSEDTMTKLFKHDQPFEAGASGPQPGSQLGLFIAKEFISRQGGSIDVETVLGEGSKFIFKLPSANVKSKK